MAKRVSTEEAPQGPSNDGRGGAIALTAATPQSSAQPKPVPQAKPGFRPEKMMAQPPADDPEKSAKAGDGDIEKDGPDHAAQGDASQPEQPQLAMMQMDTAFAGTMAAAQEGAPGETTAQASSSGGGGGGSGDNTPFIVGGVLLLGGGIALAAGGGGGPNQAPTVSTGTQAVTTPEDVAVNITVSATDPDRDALNYTASAPTKGTVTGGANGAFVYTPGANFNGTDSFTVTVKDPDGLTATQTVNITVTPVNDAPTIDTTSTRAIVVAEEGVAEFFIDASDIETPDSLTAAVGALPANGTVEVTDSGNFYRPNANFNGTDSFTVKVSDGQATTEYTVNVTVTPVNDAPTVLATQAVATAEDVAVNVTVAGADVDGDALTYTASTATSGTVSGGANGAFVYTPGANFNGSDSFTVTVKDAAGLSVTQTVNVTVTPVNDAPVVSATQAVTTAEEVAVAVAVAATDIEGDTLSYAATAAANGVVTGGAGGAFVYTPNANFFGTDTFTVKVSDGVATSEQAVTVTVTNVNDAPTVLATQAVTTAEDVAVNVTVAGADVDGDALTYTASTATSGTVSGGANGAFVYTPGANFNGSDSFTVTVKDAAGLSVTQTVNVTVTPVNDAPAFASATASASVAEETVVSTIIYTAAATDVEGDTVTYALAGADAAAFSIDGATGAVRFLATPDFEVRSSYAVDVVATDSGGLGTSQALTVGVTNVLGEPISLDIDNDGNVSTAKVFDASLDNSDYRDSAAIANNVLITGFAAGDTILVDAAASEYGFAKVGDDLQISANIGGVLSTILLDLSLGSGVTIYNEFTAERALGFDFFQSSVAPPTPLPPLTVNVDVDNDGNQSTAAQFDAAGNSVTFTESGNTPNNARIINFTSDDKIVVSNASDGDYSFGALGNDIEVTFNSPTAGVSTIILVYAVQAPSGTFVFDEASAEIAAGFDFFQIV